jgi:DNA-binding NarL/FixJ family response regulator
MIRIAIIDDHPLIVNGLQLMLQSAPDLTITGSFMRAADLLEALPKLQPDVLLIDIQMPDKTGPELAKIVRQKYPDIRMIALTNLDNNFYIKSMLRNGVSGYVLKSSDQEVLLEAIRTVAEGKEYLEPGMRERVWEDMVKGRRQGNSTPPLTRREKEILVLIANEHTTQEIASMLFLSTNTVETHRLNLLSKLDVKNTAGLVKKAMKMGLVE